MSGDGRTVDNPKTYQIFTRVDKKTYDDIQKICNKMDITGSQFLRTAVDIVLEVSKKERVID